MTNTKSNINAQLPVSSLMSTDVISVHESMRLNEFIKAFDRRAIHHILVEDDSRKLIGIISKSDVDKNRAFYLDEKLLASHLMTENPVSATSTITLEQAALIFQNNRFRALPIVDNEKIVGIITPYDFLSCFINQK